MGTLLIKLPIYEITTHRQSTLRDDVKCSIVKLKLDVALLDYMWE